MPQIRPTDRSQLLVIQVIWGALVASLGMLVFVVHNFEQGEGGNLDSEFIAQLNSIFPLCAIAILGVSFAIRNLNVPAAQPTNVQLTPGQQAIARYLPRMLIRCALHEAAAILGFVLAKLSDSPEAMYPYVAAAIVANLFVFPSAERVGVK